MVRAAGVRVAQADADDLRELLTLREATEQAILTAVSGLRDQGVTWHDIGAASGTTRQAAILRWHHRITTAPHDCARAGEPGQEPAFCPSCA